MFRRLLLAVLLTASVTLSGVSSCEDPLGGLGGPPTCNSNTQGCYLGESAAKQIGVNCCEGLVCAGPYSNGWGTCKPE